LWGGGVNGLVLTGSGIRAQSPDVQRRIRDAFDRRASVYRDGDGFNVPVAFNVGSGRKPQ
jgi:hypothetical protein